jgi:hypothetical protein
LCKLVATQLPSIQSIKISGLKHEGEAFIPKIICYHDFPSDSNFHYCCSSNRSFIKENAVGISLVLIGLLGVKESLESDHYHPDASLNEIQEKKSMRNRAIFANGVLHGFSWDGAPSIAPALAISTWQAAVYFLLAYSLGTVLAMSISASAIGALSSKISKLGNFSKSPDFPKKISLYSSMLATVIGIYWIALTIFK